MHREEIPSRRGIEKWKRPGRGREVLGKAHSILAIPSL
jgi:hypothetical protein